MVLVTRACRPAPGATCRHQAGLSNAAVQPAGLPALLQEQRRQRRRRAAPVRAAPDEDLDQQLQADLDRLRQRQAATNGAGPSAQQRQQAAARFEGSRSSSSSGSGGALGGLKDAVDKLLIADFFFILFALGWLGAGLAERSTLQSTNLLDAWLSLWQWVFQPAIGVLMLGALVSGAFGWAKENLGQEQR
ncbi:hypothetical protein C2E20_1148 [Micractinium conductrix]|uniref:Uncharacterized protein n=1 Tax=Micractinium conductrix TaxID=554055 RepID=A0A2P6VPC5_9CHLO|nr:hypothetical protein C2E20_1148 [Micractinium conductrix]|eukprot:PSC75919.1 hypothetical protein C2E20_1148 [Micractinium conductrix]